MQLAFVLLKTTIISSGFVVVGCFELHISQNIKHCFKAGVLCFCVMFNKIRRKNRDLLLHIRRKNRDPLLHIHYETEAHKKRQTSCVFENIPELLNAG